MYQYSHISIFHYQNIPRGGVDVFSWQILTNFWAIRTMLGQWGSTDQSNENTTLETTCFKFIHFQISLAKGNQAN